MRGEVSTLGSSGDTTRVCDVGHCERDVFQLLNKIGDAGDSRGTSAFVTSSIWASPVVEDAEGSGTLAASGTRVREPDERGGRAKVLVDSGIGRVSDAWWGVEARAGPSDLEDEAAGFSAAAGESEILSGLEGGVGENECA